MSTWAAQTTVHARPEDVLHVLTDPLACARWAPVDFDVEGLDAGRLRQGTSARVIGRLAGQRVAFDIDVRKLAADRLELTATGPMALDVEYEIVSAGDASRLSARIAVRDGRGLNGRLVARATEALLAGGALSAAIARIGHQAELAPA